MMALPWPLNPLFEQFEAIEAELKALRESNEANRNAKGLEPGTVTVDSSSTKIVGRNRNRLAVVLQNAGPKDVFLGFDNPAEMDKGFRLDSGEIQILGIVNTGRINGIVSSSTATVLFQEFEV